MTGSLSSSYSEVRQHLKQSFDQVCRDHTILTVHRKNGENVVILSESDYLSLEETVYLSRSPKNLRRLLSALESSENIPLEDVKKRLGL